MSSVPLILVACFVVVATGCWPFPSSRSIASVIDPITATVGQPDDQPIDLGDEKSITERIRFLNRELAASQADLKQVRTEADRKRILFLQRSCMVVAGAALLASFAGIALWFLLDGARKTIGAALLASAAVFGAALVAYSTIGYIVALLPWLVGAAAVLTIAGVTWGVVQLIRNSREAEDNKTVAKVAASAFDKLELAVKDWADPGEATDLLSAVKEEVAADQERAGVREKLAAIRAAPVAKKKFA